MKAIGTPDAQDWVARKGFKDPDALAIAARESERALSGRVALPAADAPPEEWGKLWQRLGRPENAEGYTIALPEGFEPSEDGKAFTEGFRSKAFEAGLNQNQVSALVAFNNEAAVAQLAKDAAAKDAEKQALRTDWGAKFGENSELARRGMKVLGLDNNAIDKMALGLGVKDTLNLMRQLGQMTSEDVLARGDTPGFTVDLSTAQAQLDKFVTNPVKGTALRSNDPSVKAEYDRLKAAVVQATLAKRAS